jgi:hypothetical protein
MSEIVHIIENNSLRATESGFELRLRFKWYRSLPLSCIEGLQLSIDGQPVDSALMRFSINGGDYTLEQLADRVEEFWFILDPAILSVDQPGRIKSGESHQIDVVFGMRAPYIQIGPGKFLTIMNKYSTVQVAA